MRNQQFLNHKLIHRSVSRQAAAFIAALLSLVLLPEPATGQIPLPPPPGHPQGPAVAAPRGPSNNLNTNDKSNPSNSRSTVDAKELAKAIEKGANWLLQQQLNDGSINGSDDDTVFAAIAMLECGATVRSPAIQKMLAYLAAQRSRETRFIALRAEAFALAAASGGPAARRIYEPLVAADFKVIRENQDENGLWQYRARRNADVGVTFDVVCAVQSCAAEGYRLPDAALQNVIAAYFSLQNRNGGWSYSPDGPDRQMSFPDSTMSALACLMAYGLDPSGTDDATRLNDKLQTSIQSGLTFMTKSISLRDEARGRDDRDRGFYSRAYIIGRMLKYVDLESLSNAKIVAEWVNPVMARQQDDGRWRGVRETAFVLYMLGQLRPTPIIAEITDTTKPPTANRLLVNQTKSLSRALPQPVTYCRARLSEDERYMDLPLIVLDVPEDWKLAAEERQNLIDYVAGGGTILLIAPLQQREEAAALAEKLAELWPQTPLEALQRNDPMWTARETPSTKPICHGLSDGVRTFLFALNRHTAIELAFGRYGTRGSNMATINNILAYASEGRFESGQLLAEEPADTAEPQIGPQKIVAIGAATAEESDFQKLGLPVAPYNGFAAAAGLLPASAGVKVLGPKAINAADENLGLCDLLYVPISSSTDFSQDELDGLKKYIAEGGFVFIEGRAGELAADRNTKKIIDSLGLKAESVRDHSLLSGQFADPARGYNVQQLAVRQDGKLLPARNTDLRVLKSGELIVGVYSPLDLVVSASGIPCFGLRGYATNDARRILANLIIHRTTR